MKKIFQKHFFLLCLLGSLVLVSSCYDDTELQNRVDTLEETTVTGINQQLSILQSSIDVLQSRYDQIWQLLPALEESGQTQQVEIDDLKQQQAALLAQIEQLQQSVSELQAWAAEALQNYYTKEESAALLQEIQSHIDAVNTTLQEQITLLQESLSAISEQVAKLLATPEIIFDGTTDRAYSPGTTVTISYTLINADDSTMVECLSDAGWEATVTPATAQSGTITVATPAAGGRGKVIVLVGNAHTTIMRVLSFEEGTLQVVTDVTAVAAADTLLAIETHTNIDFRVAIPADAQSWIELSEGDTRATMRTEVITLSIKKNDTGAQRTAVISLVDLSDKELSSFSIVQEANTDELSDEERYTFIGVWPQSAIKPGGSLCGGELAKLVGKISGSTYFSGNHMGKAFQSDHRATDEEKAWLADYTAKPAEMDGFSRWMSRRVTLYPNGKPIPADCNQHAIGDCNTVSTLATMAYLYPRFIQSIITQVSDKEFQVKMFDPDGNRIVVGVDNKVLCTDDAYIAQMTGKASRITWSTILEKAIMKWFTVYRPSAQLGGFGAEGMTPLFTGDGRSFAVSPGKCTPQELQQFATISLQHGLIVNGGFNKQGLKLGSHETITYHGHSIFLANDPNALFAMRNPWGQEPDDHVMQIYDADHAPAGYDGTIPSTIDFRIISPGIASLYYDGPIQPYDIP